MPQVVSAPQKTKKKDLLLFGIYCFFCYIFILFTAIFGNLFILEPYPEMFKEEGMDNPDFLTFFQVILWQFLRTLHSINLYFFFLWFVKLTEMPICISDLQYKKITVSYLKGTGSIPRNTCYLTAMMRLKICFLIHIIKRNLLQSMPQSIKLANTYSITLYFKFCH